MLDSPQNPAVAPPAGAEPDLRLLLLGDFAVIGPDGQQVPIPTKKNRAMLAILALSPGRRVTRERLCGLLWSDRAEEQARSSLRQALAMLRKELGALDEKVIQTRDDQILLHAVFVDADAVAAAARTCDVEACRRAAGLLRGELLADTAIRDEAFEPWLAAERRKYADAAAAVLEKLALAENGRDRITHAKRLVEMDPLREASHRTLMLAYHESGENGLALKQFETCRQLLRDELSVEPALTTLELRRRLVANTAAEQVSSLVPALTIGSKPPAICVLPFKILEDDPQQQYLATGFTADIATELARFRQLRVTKSEAGEFDYGLSGSIRKAGGRIRITIELTKAASSETVWAEKYDREEDALFAIQDDVVRIIVTTLAGRIILEQVDAARRKPPNSLAAYECVLMADAMTWRSIESNHKAQELCLKALELDPGYARAHTLLGVLRFREWLDNIETPDSLLDDALVSMQKARALDDNDSYCHHALGELQLWRREYESSAEHHRRAVLLNPNRPTMLTGLAHLALYEGRTDEAIELYHKAKAIDPYFNPDWYWSTLGIIHYVAKDYREALACFARVPDERDWVEAHVAASHAMRGETAKARLHSARTLVLNPKFTIEKCLARDPYRYAANREHVIDGMTRAELPFDRQGSAKLSGLL